MVQGRGVDASLNETGIMQAKKVGKALASVSFDHVFISSLTRTRETIAQFIPDNIPLTVDEGLDEISWGNQEGVVADYAAKNLYAKTVNGWREGNLDLCVGGGESPLQVMARQKKAMQQVLNANGDTILICMHGRAMRILLCWMLNYPLNFMDGFPHENCSYYVLQSSGTHMFVKQFNQTKHLM